MLDKIKELSISFWSPVGEFFNSVFGTSNLWTPIVAYVIGSIVILYIVKRFLDKTVSSATTLTLNTLGSLLKKVVLYSFIGAIILSLYFYINEIYHKYQPVEKEQSLDYLLR